MLAIMTFHDASSPSPSRRCQTTSRGTGVADAGCSNGIADRSCGPESCAQTRTKPRQAGHKDMPASLRNLASPGQTCSGKGQSIRKCVLQDSRQVGM